MTGSAWLDGQNGRTVKGLRRGGRKVRFHVRTVAAAPAYFLAICRGGAATCGVFAARARSMASTNLASIPIRRSSASLRSRSLLVALKRGKHRLWITPSQQRERIGTRGDDVIAPGRAQGLVAFRGVPVPRRPVLGDTPVPRRALDGGGSHAPNRGGTG